MVEVSVSPKGLSKGAWAGYLDILDLPGPDHSCYSYLSYVVEAGVSPDGLTKERMLVSLMS